MAVIRRARLDDAASIAAVQVASWRSTYPGMIPDRHLLSLSVPRSSDRWRIMLGQERQAARTYVAETPDDGIVGFGSCGRQRTKLPGLAGEFFALYLLGDHQGQGIGRRLLAAMAGHLLDHGIRTAVVWVLDANPSRWFYEHLGGIRIADQTIQFAGDMLLETAFAWYDLVPLARLTADPAVD